MRFTFEFNDEVIEIHQPEETWHSGKHSILLYYPIEGLIANYRNIFHVYMRVAGGSALVETGGCLASVSGQSMGAGEAWDGEIRIEEYIRRAAVSGGLWAVPVSDNVSYQIDETMRCGYSDVVCGRIAVGAFARPVETEV